MLLFLYAGDIGTFAIHVVNFLGFGVAAIVAGFRIAPSGWAQPFIFYAGVIVVVTAVGVLVRAVLSRDPRPRCR